MDNASKAEMIDRVCAVIVAFNPEEDHLGELLRECLDQCDGVVVLVNNGSSLGSSSLSIRTAYTSLTCEKILA